jgi:hypothetical protein
MSGSCSQAIPIIKFYHSTSSDFSKRRVDNPYTTPLPSAEQPGNTLFSFRLTSHPMGMRIIVSIPGLELFHILNALKNLLTCSARPKFFSGNIAAFPV